MRKNQAIQVVLLLLAFVAGPAVGAPRPELPLPGFVDPELAPDEGLDLSDMLDGRHAQLSGQVVELGRRLDRFFGGQQYAGDTKTSELRLGLTTLFSEDEIEFDTRVRFRLALPSTERRLSIILESAEDDLFEPGEQNTRSFGRRPFEEDADYFAGLRYVSELAENWGIDTDAGVKLRLPPDPYFRVRGRHSWFVELWEARLSQSLFWRRSEGKGATTELLLQRILGKKLFLQSTSQATWLDRDQRFYYSQDIVVTRPFSSLNALQLRLGVRAESEPEHHVTSYLINLPWRRNIYRRWLFMELRPELLFEEETDFDPQPRLFVTLEAFFGEPQLAHKPRPDLLPQL